MIGTALQFVTREINKFISLRLRTEASNRRIALASHVSPDGTFAGIEDNILLLALVGVQKDSVAQGPATRGFVPVQKGLMATVYEESTPPVFLNLQLLIAANFRAEHIQSGLDLLSMAISFLQGNTAWTRENFPGLPAGVDHLAFDLETLDFHAQSHLWGAIGAKYMPSAIYKMRMLTIDEQRVDAVVPGIISPETNLTQGS